jgi:hypothetical protein
VPAAQNWKAARGSMTKLRRTSTKSEPASAKRTRFRDLSTASVILMEAIDNPVFILVQMKSRTRWDGSERKN